MLPESCREFTDPAIPILVAVTGHRDLLPGDSGRLTESVLREFDRISSLLSKANKGKIAVLSGLAEGADRLVAEAAVKSHLDLIAVLPMPQCEYEKDFAPEDSLIQFRSLLGKAKQVIELPLLNDQLQPVNELTVVDRERQYERLGLFLSANCHHLIALWNGIDSEKRGGTSQVVKMRLGIPDSRNPLLIYSFPSLPIGYGSQIVTPRGSESSTSGEPYSRKQLIPDLWLGDVSGEGPDDKRALSIYRKIIQNTDGLNVDMYQQIRFRPHSVRKSREQLFGQQDELPNDEATDLLIERYSIIDSLANRFKFKRVQATVSLFALIVFAFVWFEIHVKILPHLQNIPSFLPFAGYLIIFVSIGAVYLLAKRGRFDEKHEDYRVLAEAIRVQIIWRLSGLSESVTYNCIPRQLGELSWIRTALFGMVQPCLDKGALKTPILEFVRREWVQGQAKWYQSRKLTNSSAVERIAVHGGVLLLSCSLIALILCHSSLSPLHELDGWQLWTSKSLIVLTAVLLAIAAARHGYADMMAWSAQTYQYERMASVFGLANRVFSTVEEARRGIDCSEILIMLGKEALTEHCDWLVMHRARPLEVPRL